MNATTDSNRQDAKAAKRPIRKWHLDRGYVQRYTRIPWVRIGELAILEASEGRCLIIEFSWRPWRLGGSFLTLVLTRLHVQHLVRLEHDARRLELLDLLR